MDKVRILSNVTTFYDVQKSLQEIEKILNSLSTATSTEAETEVEDTEGESGNIQITMNEDKTYTFEIRTEDGWKTPLIGDSAVKFKDKPAAKSKNQKKSIDEIEADDTSTSAKVAEKTIYDEKADKFVIARPDYDSGWIDANASSSNGATLTHNLETIPKFGVVHICRDSAYNDGDPNEVLMYPVNSDISYGYSGWAYNVGPYFHFTKTTAIYWIHHNGYLFRNYGSITQADTATLDENGYFRLLLWK